MDAVSLAQPLPGTDSRPSIAAGILGAVGLLLLYSAIIAVSSQSWAHLVAQWRSDAVFIVLVAGGFGTQLGLYRHARRVIGADGRAAALSAGGTATSTTAMIACCLHHLADVVPLLGLSVAATFLIRYRLPVIGLSLAANAAGIVLVLRSLQHARRMARPASGPAYRDAGGGG